MAMMSTTPEPTSGVVVPARDPLFTVGERQARRRPASCPATGAWPAT